MRKTIMSKGQRGNKEAKKPKKAAAPVVPPASVGTTPTPTQASATPPRLKR
jgi:hypothetical protein